MYPVMLGAVVIDSTNNVIRLKEGASATVSATVLAGTYFLRGDGTSDDLLLAIKAALDLAGATYTPTITRSVDSAVRSGIVVVTGSTSFQLMFADGLNTFDETLLGFAAGVNTTAGLTSTSTLSPAAMWVAPEVNRDLEPVIEKQVAVRRAANGKVRGVQRSSKMTSYRLAFSFVQEKRMLSTRNTTDSNASLEAFMDRFGANARFELHDVDVSSGATLVALTSSTLVSQVHFSEDTLTRFEPMRAAPGTPLYSWSGVLHQRVA
jgi:hypothetical protein